MMNNDTKIYTKFIAVNDNTLRLPCNRVEENDHLFAIIKTYFTFFTYFTIFILLLYIKFKQHYITILHDIVFPF